MRTTGLSFEQAVRQATEKAAEIGNTYYVLGKADSKSWNFKVTDYPVQDQVQFEITPEKAKEAMSEVVYKDSNKGTKIGGIRI
jgi:hypothetical protein